MRKLRYLFARQHGVARGSHLDMSPPAITRAVQAGRLFRQYRDVYSLLPELTREGEWLAAVFAAGGGAGLASLNAGVLWEVSRFKPKGITVAVPKRRRNQGFELIVGLDPRDLTIRNAIPVTTLPRTFDDMTRVLFPEQVTNVIHEAAFKRRFSLEAARARGNKKLDRAIDMHLSGSAGTRSNLEDRFMVLVRHGRFPMPVINTHVHGVEVDFRWGDYCVEVDGPNHERTNTEANDRANEEKLKAHGLTVVRFTADTIDHEPGLVLRELAAQKLARRVARK